MMRSNFPVITPRIGWFPANVHAFSTTRVGGVSHAPYEGSNTQDGFNLGDHVGDDPKLVAFNRKILNYLICSYLRE